MAGLLKRHCCLLPLRGCRIGLLGKDANLPMLVRAQFERRQVQARNRGLRLLDFDGLNAVIGTPELMALGRRYDAGG